MLLEDEFARAVRRGAFVGVRVFAFDFDFALAMLEAPWADGHSELLSITYLHDASNFYAVVPAKAGTTKLMHLLRELVSLNNARCFVE